jgi:signal transduction histidine kinase/CheY-like chemotaxis protein/competence protein ComGC
VEIEQTVKKRKKITKLLLILLMILLSLVCIKYLISKSNKYISENGKSSMGAVVEQIQQTYDLQVSGYYSQLQLVEEFLLHERELSLETDTNKSFFEAWEKESESTLIFLRENGQAISAGGTKMRIDMPSKFLLDLKNGYNIGKLVRLDYDQKKKDGYLVAIPCQEYTINGETYTAIGTVYDHSKLDSMLKLKGYDGKAYLFMLDDDGNITYTNLSGDKYQRNYSLLKHLKGEQGITEEEADLLKKKFDNRESGVALLGKQNPYYLGYCPLESNNTILVCIVAKGVIDNVLRDYQKTVLCTTTLMAGFILLLFAGLFYSISRLSLADQKAEYEKRKNELHLQTMKEMEVVNQKLKKAKNVATEALQTAENANKAKTDFLSNMSHDIRTPMNAIIGITSLIRHDAGNKAKVIEYADKIDISSQHLLGIINDVLDMSKIEAGKTVFKYSDFSILDLVQELDTIFHTQIYEKQQTLTIIKENIQHEWVNGDQVHLMQIFSNLLSNAVKYTQEGGEIQFFVEECETKSSVYAKYRILVSDNGMGMSADFKDTIFDAFTRAESSLTNKIQGTGLGMAITKNLVEAMGGTIDVDSELGQGSCFEVLMDLKIAEDRTASLAAQEETDEQDGNIMQGMKFLCAEDNELNAEILTELLKIEGAECTICENGEEILKAFEQSAPGDYDMILMDVQMPVMNGYEATKAIRRSSHELAKTIPIIAMTANAFSEDIQHSLAAGMNAHVSKPVEMKVLEKTIRSIKSGGGGGVPNRRSLYSDEWKVTGYRRIKKDS